MIGNHLQQTYLDYLKYLNTGGQRVRVPEVQHNSARGEGMVYASALLRCPLKTALERYKVPQKFPLSDGELLSDLHLMQQGVRDAEPIQEAFMWKYGTMGLVMRDGTLHRTKKSRNAAARTEYSVENTEIGVRGRLDVVLYLGGALHLVEIKRRDTPARHDEPQPRATDCFQLMAYALATGITSMHIVTVNRYFFNVWHLKPEGDGFRVYNQRDELWDNEANTPDYLNLLSVRAEISRQQRVLHAVKEEKIVPPPIADPLNDPEGWLCLRWENGQKPKKYKKTYQGRDERTEFAVRACPYFCHSNSAGPFEAREVEDGKFEFISGDIATNVQS